ncbi:hemolysin family protein [Altererythrobacter sp. TH136]|uniref:hemolysin family protein n=1 Tax=Altererythrobacter sp. TH136 TaxID=2067415 RepID=UPI001163BD3F|nr:hemolysin family protein [Altererythrobacter sp. TH136]QDM41180.1 HlyC/CorC family transporter [Altererythrobacter sp. TH136]
MTPFPWTDVLIIAGLLLLNGVFAMSELAIVSAKPSRLKAIADRGSKGAKVAQALAGDPGKFLSTVQIGITMVGIVAGAYSGSSLGGPVGERLAALGIPAEYAPEAGFALVIAITTYFSVVVGELVPKQIALRAAVPIALIAAQPMALLSRVAMPVVWLLDTSSSLLIRLLGVRAAGQGTVTSEELHMIFTEATHSGVIEKGQSQILAGVVRLAERPVRELMTPRTELDWLDLNAPEVDLRARIDASPHSVLPVADGSPDRVVGVVKAREVLRVLLAGQPVDLSALMKKPDVVPDQLDAMDALRSLQQAEVAMAMVHDEYGHLEGIVTPVDLLTAIVGNFASDQDLGEAPTITEREDGSLLISGALPADQLADRLCIDLPEDREFATAAGYVLWSLKKLPEEGESFVDQGWRIEVIDMDGRKIDKLLAVCL